MFENSSQKDIKYLLENPIIRKNEKDAYCNICECNISPGIEITVNLHTQGKNHQKKLLFYKNLNNARQRSIHITGIKSTLTKENFFDYFQTFGNVKNYSFAANQAGYAFIEYESELSVIRILETSQIHNINDCALKIAKRETKIQKPNKKTISNCQLIDRTISSELNRLCNVYFRK
uniref:Speckle targeted PIP5K1A-regulated poly(A) polymerase (Trinotate prediction) n=1 Tax=Henneguya salminicola TaxID=69463 RepID=A0A6G3MGP2_HENSL